MSIEPLGTNLSEYVYRNKNIFIEEYAFEHVVCEISTIFHFVNVLSVFQSSDNAGVSDVSPGALIHQAGVVFILTFQRGMKLCD